MYPSQFPSVDFKETEVSESNSETPARHSVALKMAEVEFQNFMNSIMDRNGNCKFHKSTLFMLVEHYHSF